MWNAPDNERLAKIPRLYETEETPLMDKEIHLHFFLGGSDWYIAEYDGQDLFWGFACLNRDLQNAEWGYVSFSELKSIKVCGMEIDCELQEFWKIKKAREIDLICEAMGWQKPSASNPEANGG